MRLWGSKVPHLKLYNNLEPPRTNQRQSQADSCGLGPHRGKERPVTGEKVGPQIRVVKFIFWISVLLI